MATSFDELEQRVSRLESELAALVRASNDRETKKDWRRTAGMFSGDEVMRAIDEAALRYREQDRAATSDADAPNGEP
jgi:hypothetical protein